jgi:hypothetical protein
MAARVHIGPLFGTTGLFISRPGDDVHNPTQPLLVDSRFGSFDLHASGRVQMPVIDNSAGKRVWQGAWAFPPLPYLPLFWFSFVERSSNFAYFPPVSFLRGAITTGLANLAYKSCDADNGTIRAKAETFAGTNPPPQQQLDLQFIIFKNPR